MNKKYSLGLLLGVIAFSTSAQQLGIQKTFPPAPASQLENPFLGVREGDLIVADFTGDSIPDIVVAGTNNDFVTRTTLYVGDANGNFSPSFNSNLPNLSTCKLAHADIDGDGDQDVLIAGLSSSGPPETSLYTNNGFGVFLKVQSVPFINVSRASLAFGDVDGDGDPDLIIAGDKGGLVETEMYINGGAGGFTVSTANSFPITRDGDIEFADVDGDGDLDFIMVGNSNLGNNYLSQLYLNNGSGTFSLSTNTFTPVNDAAVEFLDSDQDGDMDLLIAGRIAGNFGSTELYINNGSGSFSPSSISVFEQYYHPAIATGDLTGDGYPEIFISGDTTGLRIRSQLLINDGSGGYYLDTLSEIDKFTKGAAEMFDLDGDTALDLIIAGEKFGFVFQGIMFHNDGSGVLHEAGGSYFEGVASSAIDTADVDGDGDLDIFISGYNQDRYPISNLYINNGAGAYTRSTQKFIGVGAGKCLFNDVNNDGDFDLILMGRDTASNEIAEVYFNNGSGVFIAAGARGLSGYRLGALKASDLDNDGDDDLFVTGRNSFNVSDADIYLNDGAGNYTSTSPGSFTGLFYSSASINDIDGDGDPDIVVSGLELNNTPRSQVFINTGSGFTLQANSQLVALENGAVELADYDGDGDLDLLTTGEDIINQPESNLYLNDGSGNFTKDLSQNLVGLNASDASFADFDGDGDPDILMAGLDVNGIQQSLVYANDSGIFNSVSSNAVRGLYSGDLITADLDQDGIIEAIMTGYNSSGQFSSYLYGVVGCAPSSSTDSVVACDSLTWIDGSTYYASNDSATYLLQTAYGCDSVVTLNLTIPEFDTSVMYTSVNSIMVGDTVSSIQWVDCSTGIPVSGASGNSFSSSIPGTYAAVLEQGGCYDTTFCFQLPFASIEERLWSHTPKVYPNPSNGRLNIDLGLNCHDVLIEVYDHAGKVVFTENHPSGQRFSLSLPELSGNYLLKVYSSEEAFAGVTVRFK